MIDNFAVAAGNATGGTFAFVFACVLVVGSLAAGPIFKFSYTWLAAINTATSVITFLMVFLIQKNQNKDSLAMQVKLNELVAANALASNRIISVEDLTEQELIVLNNYYTKLAAMTKDANKVKSSHSIEDAIESFPPTDDQQDKGQKKQ
jgi:low affinity Fe/Cu permease